MSEHQAAGPPERFEAPASSPRVKPTAEAIVPRVAGQSLVDGQWHRLHPATPLLRGGIAFVAILGIVIANLRERLIEFFIPAPGMEQPTDPIDYILNHGFVGWVLLAIAVGLIVVIAVFWFSWRMHTFRVTDEAVEVRSGILFRTNRKAKLDRIQGVSIEKPLLARLIGASRINVSVAGQDANVKLEYLYGADADGLRRDVLTLASGVKLAERRQAAAAGDPADPTQPPRPAPDGTGGVSRFVTERVDDFISPELDPEEAVPDSVVRLTLGRLVGSTLLSPFTVIVLISVVVGVILLANGLDWAWFWLVPMVLSLGAFVWSGVTKSLRYSIAATPSGVRIGFGLFSTTNDTVPPGRIHAIEVSQPIIWRPFGWWRVRINKAGLSLEQAARGATSNTVLPVGSLVDAAQVVELMLAGRIDGSAWAPLQSALATRDGVGFVGSPRRSRWINWFSWRRTGYALRDGMLLFRQGVVWRKLHILPLARLQSLRINQGPLLRALDLASATAHTVPGPVIAKLPAMARDEAVRMFGAASAAIVVAQSTDRSHRWASFDPEHQPSEAQATAPYLGEPVSPSDTQPMTEADAEPWQGQSPAPSVPLPTTDHDRRNT
ncbi:PH domain-containing protein [Plantibacter sp. ME-Dv--P-122b]|uniref:PH domain-containing protein n=1 Tax=Plantibacter sp. ME-Dv--P-122b TaxID=3040300 RepID=UPI002549F083|nr:PH domain-containing protein [Plantibacter sp. ME-Dv--P-122b]